MFNIEIEQLVTDAVVANLIVGLNGVKAERDATNQSFDLNMPPVLLNVLVKLCHGVFVRKVLDPYCEHFAKFWSPQNIDQIEADHCTLLKAYNTNNVLRIAIESDDVVTTFNDTWDCASGRYERLHSFCGGLLTVFANTNLVVFRV